MEEMVMNEVMNNEVTDVMETASKVSGSNGTGKVVFGLILSGVALVGGILYKNREKITAKKEEREVAKMKKKGYVCYKMVDGEIIKEDSVEELEEE